MRVRVLKISPNLQRNKCDPLSGGATSRPEADSFVRRVYLFKFKSDYVMKMAFNVRRRR